MLIPAHDKILIDTGIAFQIPMGYYGQIASRSGLAICHHIHVGAGVVDPDYTGSVHVLLINFSCPGPCDRKESSHSPDDSKKSGLSGHLWSATDAPNRAWCPWIWLHRTMSVLEREEPNWSLTSYKPSL